MIGKFRRLNHWTRVVMASLVISIAAFLGTVAFSQPVEAVAYQNSTNCATIGSSYVILKYEGGTPTYGCKPTTSIITAKGDGGKITTPLGSQIDSLLYYRAVGYCLKSSTVISSSQTSAYYEFTESDAAGSSWFYQGSPSGQLYLPYFKGKFGISDKSGKVDCNSDAMRTLMQKAKETWSLEYDNWMCAAGWMRQDVVNELGNNYLPVSDSVILSASKRCTNEDAGGNGPFAYFGSYYPLEAQTDGSTKTPYRGHFWLPATNADRSAFPYDSKNVVADQMLTVVRDKMYGGETPAPNNPLLYQLYRTVFFNTCSSSPNWTSGGNTKAPATILSSDFKAHIIDVSEDGKTVTEVDKWFTYASGYNKNTSVNVLPKGWSDDFAPQSKTCQQMLDDMAGTIGTDFKKDLQYRIENGEPVEQGNETGAGAEGDTSCSITGIGWLICPVFNFLAGITDGIYQSIQVLLETNVGIFDTNSGTYTAWTAMRNVANVGFVIVFLIIIFSQISNVGVTNYGVKKLLPRIIIAALLVNLSYLVCQIAVDISNIIGGSLKGFLDSLPIFPEAKTILDKSTWITELTTNILAGQLIAGTAIAVGAITALTGIGLLIPIILGALLALVVMYFILVARQALIILLIVIAPLAFLAMLLPNTENYFKQWRKVFVALLLVYPMVALLFGGSRLAAGVLLSSLGTDLFGKLAALAVLIIPLFVLPSVIKNSLNAIPAIGKLASNLQTRANSRVANKAKEFGAATPIARGMALRKQARANYRDRKFAEGMSKKGSLTSGLARGLLRADLLPPGSKLSKAAGKVMGASLESQKALTRSASGAAEKEEMADIGYAQQEITQGSLDAAAQNGPEAAFTYAQQQLEQAIEEGDTVKAKAAFTSLHKMGQTGVVRAADSIAKLHAKHGYSDDMRSLGRYMRAAHPDVKQSDNRLNKWTEGDASGLMATASNSSTHLDGLRDGEIATQSGASIRTGQLDAAVAARILNDPNLQKEFKPDTRTALMEKAGDLYKAPAGDGTQPIPAADDDHPTLF